MYGPVRSQLNPTFVCCLQIISSSQSYLFCSPFFSRSLSGNLSIHPKCFNTPDEQVKGQVSAFLGVLSFHFLPPLPQSIFQERAFCKARIILLQAERENKSCKYPIYKGTPPHMKLPLPWFLGSTAIHATTFLKTLFSQMFSYIPALILCSGLNKTQNCIAQ